MADTVALLHSSLTVPHAYPLTVVFCEYLHLSEGEAFRAHVHRDGDHVGYIENYGDSYGEARFVPLDFDVFGLHDFHRFVTECRSNGEPVSDQQVLAALLDEYETSLALGVQVGRGRTLARQVADGYAATFVEVDRPQSRAGRRRLAGQLPSEPGHRWEVWTGFRWEPLEPPPPK